MLTTYRALSFLGLLTASATLQGFACANTAEDCSLLGTACPGETPGTTSTGTDGGSDGGKPLCEQDPRESPGSVIDKCGIFVKSGAMVGGDGSMAAPFSALKAGVDAAVAQQKKRVYACVGSFTELVTLPAGITTISGHVGQGCPSAS